MIAGSVEEARAKLAAWDRDPLPPGVARGDVDKIQTVAFLFPGEGSPYQGFRQTECQMPYGAAVSPGATGVSPVLHGDTGKMPVPPDRTERQPHIDGLPGVGRQLYETLPSFRKAVRHCDDALRGILAGTLRRFIGQMTKE